MTSRGGTRPWCIANAYLFDAPELRADQLARGIKAGVASSVRAALWTTAEIYPNPTHPIFRITPEQASALGHFAV